MMRIGNRHIGPGHAPYIIAEIGVNHDGDAARALELVDAAADGGADAVKVQIFQADLLMSAGSRLAAYQRSAGEDDPRAMLRRLELDHATLASVVARAHRRSIHAIATIFSVDLVESACAHGWDALKTASPDIVHAPLLRALAAQSLPLIVSTGAATLEEIDQAAAWLEHARDRLALLQCVSAYPAPDEHAALGAIRALAHAYDLPVGYSDHTIRIETGALAVCVGACLLEKHLTHDRASQGPDHAASVDPDGLAQYVDLARTAHRMLGDGAKRVLPIEEDVRAVSRQSLVLREPVHTGQRIEATNLMCKRPGNGIAPSRLESAVGRMAARDVPADTPLVEEDLA